MTTEIVHSPAPAFSEDQISLIKRTVAKDTTNDELALFLHTAQRMGLDPLAKQIHCVVRKGQERSMSIQTGIDGLRLIAHRTGMLDGEDGPFWCSKDGVWHDVWLQDEQPAAAKVVVYRKGSARPFTGVATWDSYVQTKADGTPNRSWNRMGDVMLAKCAEALALRKAFPAELSGVYSNEEMMQADNPEPEPKNPNDNRAPKPQPSAQGPMFTAMSGWEGNETWTGKPLASADLDTLLVYRAVIAQALESSKNPQRRDWFSAHLSDIDLALHLKEKPAEEPAA
jgi:phage recombination protein Bet